MRRSVVLSVVLVIFIGCILVGRASRLFADEAVRQVIGFPFETPAVRAAVPRIGAFYAAMQERFLASSPKRGDFAKPEAQREIDCGYRGRQSYA